MEKFKGFENLITTTPTTTTTTFVAAEVQKSINQIT